MPVPPILARLFSSNDTPQCHEIPFLEAEISFLTDEISLLQSKLRSLEELLQNYHAVSSAIRKMPLEILGEIFSFVVPCVRTQAHKRNLSNLGLVCRGWYDAVKLTHHLWDHLQIEGPLSYIDIVSWFQRAGNVPKTLEMATNPGNCKCHYPSLDCQLASSELAKVLLEGPTLTHLSLECFGPRCFQNMIYRMLQEPAGTLLLSNPRPWDSLRSLTLIFSNDWRWDHSTGLDSPFLHVPSSVSSFQLYLPFGSGRESLHLPPSFLKRLTSFTISCGWNVTHILGVLRDCVNVQTLTLDFQGRECNFVSDPGIQLPELRSLYLKLTPDLRILESVITPRLVELDVEFTPDDEYEPQRKLGSFGILMETSDCAASLQHLRFECASLNALELSQTLCRIPNLTHLTLDGVIGTDSDAFTLFSNLERANRRRMPSLPRLEAMELKHLPSDFFFCHLSSYIKSRRCHYKQGEVDSEGHHDSLRELNLTFQCSRLPVNHSLKLEASKDVELFKDLGMVISFGALYI